MENNRESARRWMLTINNPVKNDDELKKYIEELEHIKYAVFQREKGHEKETEHIQLFLIFSIGKRFSTVKAYFETAHIEKANGSNVQCRDYCTKSDTRVGEPVEIGKFSEERARTDIQTFYELLDNGVSNVELRNLFPSLFLKEFNKLQALRSMKKVDVFKYQERTVEVSFIYGPAGSGKSTYVRDLTRNLKTFSVDTFDNSAFTGYEGEDILIMDEFNGQFNIQFMNKLMDCSSVKLRGLNFLGYACFTKLYIISNFSLEQLYKQEQEENKSQYTGFTRRIHKIIRFDENQVAHVEKETEFEYIPKEEIKINGVTKRIKYYTFFNNGVAKRVYPNNKKIEQMKIETPFD